MREPANHRAAWWRSVRARTTVGATAVVAVAMTAAGLIVLATLRHNLVASAGIQAEATAREVVSQLHAGTPYAALRLPDPEDQPVQVVSTSGQVLAADEGLRRRTPMVDIAADEPDSSVGIEDDDEDQDDDGDPDDEDANDEDQDTDDQGGEPAAPTAPDAESPSVSTGSADSAKVAFTDATVTVDDDTTHEYRIAALPAAANGRPVLVYAGASLADADSAVADVRRVMLIGLAPLLAVVAAVTWLVTRRALRPVESIRAELVEIMGGDLSRRVPEPNSRDEIGRLAVTTNDTLAALEAAAERQRRFIGDAAHELRSPIASLRTQLEVAQAHPHLLELDGVIEDTVRLENLAADLLLLARLDAGERPRADRIELTDLVRTELSHRAHDRLPIEPSLPDAPITVTGSRSQLARVLCNLLDNAQRHANTTVRVEVAQLANNAVLTVADDGPGVPAADRPHIFERFVRLDDARSRDDGGAGLGLAIVRDVVEQHRGAIALIDSPLGGAEFTVTLPLG